MMHKCAAFGLLAACLTFPQSGEIEKAFAEYQRALSAADKAGAERVISDDLIYITRRGQVLSKQDVVNSMNAGPMPSIRDQKVRLYGNVAVLTYADSEGKTASRRTVVWNKTRDGWKIVSFHTSSIQQ
jgi:ketosteroid isomerase-like protein